MKHELLISMIEHEMKHLNVENYRIDGMKLIEKNLTVNSNGELEGEKHIEVKLLENKIGALPITLTIKYN